MKYSPEAISLAELTQLLWSAQGVTGAENVYLQAGALSLGTVIIGAFDDANIKQILDLPELEQPLCLLPVGRK